MIEIVCPSCEARYQVPDDSIGPEGRKVTCSSCSHKWRAYPETVGAPAAAGESRPAAPPSTPVEAEPEASADEASAGDTSRGGSREEQMDAIRRMLDDLKRSSEDEPAAEPEPAPKQTARPEPTHRRRDEEDLDDPDADPLKARIAQLDRSGKSAERPSNYDAARLRRMHEKRAKRLQKAKERKRKSGAFLTGFTLVAVVAAAVVGLYVLSPQIVATSPELEPAMNEYVVTVDRYRVALDEATADWRAWVTEKVGPLIEGDDAQNQQAQEQSETATTQ